MKGNAMRKINFTINKGSVTVAVEGACGTSCIDLTKPYEEGIGIVESDKATPDMYQQELEEERQSQ